MGDIYSLLCIIPEAKWGAEKKIRGISSYSSYCEELVNIHAFRFVSTTSVQ